jgi:glycosyltransferase involved in cell wall biosynthesis
MLVAIDARELAGRRTGTGRYLERLLERWATLPAARAHEFVLYAHEPVSPPALANARTSILQGGGGTRWEQATFAAALRRHRPDVLFAPAYTAPLLMASPIALTVHDVSFAAHPEWFRWREGWRRRLLTRASARRARVVLTVSEFSRREIERHLGVPAQRVRVIHHGIGGVDAIRADPAAAGHAHQRRTPPLVLFVGSILNRRHVSELIAALAPASRELPGIRLVLAGDNRSWPHEDPVAVARRHGVGDRVDVRSFVSDEDLRQLYAAADVFAFLSEYEGFALTPLEALAAGVPPLLLDTPVAREIYGNAAQYVARAEPSLVASHLIRLLKDDARRSELLSHAPAVLARYQWTRTAAETLSAIEEAAGL